MRQSPDGIVRQEWPSDAHLEGGLDQNPDVGGRAQYGRPPAARDAREPPVASVNTRIGEWSDRLQDLVDDELEGGGEEPSAGELIAEAAGLLQNAVDRALVNIERQIGEAAGQAANVIAALERRICELEDARRSDQERHRRLGERMQRLELQTRAEVDEVHAALRIEAAEAAEGRSIARLKQSSWMKRHNSRVGLRLVEQELERDGARPT